MAKRTYTLSVHWNGSKAPTLHPAFSSAVKNEDGSFTISYPVGSHIGNSLAQQKDWVKGKAKHLRSWGIQDISISTLNHKTELSSSKVPI